MDKFKDFYERLLAFLVSLQVMDKLNIELVIVKVNNVDTLLIKGKDQVNGGVILGIDDWTFTKKECDMLLKVLNADIMAGLKEHHCFRDSAYSNAYVFDKTSVGLVGYQFRIFRMGEYSLYWNMNLQRFAHLTL